MFFDDSRESSQDFYKLLDILEFDNIVKLRTCILAHNGYLISPPIFLHCFMIPSQ